jgi:hypothetical protein
MEESLLEIVYLGDLSDMENRSTYCAIVDKKKIWLPQSAIEDYFK